MSEKTKPGEEEQPKIVAIAYNSWPLILNPYF